LNRRENQEVLNEFVEPQCSVREQAMITNGYAPLCGAGFQKGWKGLVPRSDLLNDNLAHVSSAPRFVTESLFFSYALAVLTNDLVDHAVLLGLLSRHNEVAP
jgi:hypothetical protein